MFLFCTMLIEGTQASDLHHWTGLFDWYGNACLRLSESNCVSALSLSPSVSCLIDTVSLNSATQEDEMGRLYLSNMDFIKCGVPASMIAALVRLAAVHEPL